MLSVFAAAALLTTEPVLSAKPQIDHRRLDHAGQTYAWSIVTPPGVEPGGAALLFLHGYGECGTEGNLQLTVGLPPAVEANPDAWPFVLIVPQKPTGQSEWEDHEGAVLTMLDQAAKEGLFDPDRLAITGLSQGGHGTIMLASRSPDRFRAAAPVCGYIDRRFDESGARIAGDGATPADPGVIAAAEALGDMPLWLFHGDADSVIPVSESIALHAALRSPDSNARITRYPGVDHNSWDRAYATSELIAWLIEHTAER